MTILFFVVLNAAFWCSIEVNYSSRQKKNGLSRLKDGDSLGTSNHDLHSSKNVNKDNSQLMECFLL